MLHHLYGYPMMLSRYEVYEELAGNDSFRLCRGRCQEDGRSVFLKMPCHAPPSPFEVRQLEHEYAILQGLSLSGVLCVSALLRSDQGWCLVLEDRGGVPLPVLLAAQRLDLDTFFALALQVTTILAEVHRHEIMHKHLTPWSILVHPTTVEVCLTDFSRAARTVSEPQASLPLSLPSSTLAYLSPEQTGRMNRGVDYRTDFYALGVIFYELLTGSLPFHTEDTLELIQCHLAKLPLPPARSRRQTCNR